jgi:recombination protein RecT
VNENQTIATTSPADVGKARFNTMRDLLERSKAQFARVLPSHMDADRLLRIALTQIRTNPKLLDCTPESMVGALMKAAQLGLEPDGVTGRAYLIPRWNSRLQTNEVNFQRGFKGILDLAYRSGQIASVRADVVREGDFLEYEKGLNEKLVHRPGAQFDAPITHCYAIIGLKDGGKLWDIWSKAKIDAHRLRFSKDTRSDSVWNTDFESMAKKTLLISVGNLAPMAIEWAHAVETERTGEAVIAADIDVVDGVTGEVFNGQPATNTDKLKNAARKTKKTESAGVAEPANAGAGSPCAPLPPAAKPEIQPSGAAIPAAPFLPLDQRSVDELGVIAKGALSPGQWKSLLSHYGGSEGQLGFGLGKDGAAELKSAFLAIIEQLPRGAE